MDTLDMVRTMGRLAIDADFLVGQMAQRLAVCPTDVRALYVVKMGEQVSAKDVGARLGITSGSTTPLVDRLESRGLLRRTDHPTDRRSSLLELTPAGEDAVASALDPFQRAVSNALGDRSEADAHLVATVLDALDHGIRTESERESQLSPTV